MELKKALFLSQEISPYLPSGIVADLGRNLPQGIQEKGVEVRTFMPKYGMINERRNQLHEVIRLSGLNIVIDDTDHPLIIKVATLQPSRMQVYFIDNDDYFQRSGQTELETNTVPEDNDERVMFFARGVIETVKKLRWTPEIIHCSGWISALAPLYLRRMYADDPTLSGAKIVFSLMSGDTPEPLDARLPEKLKMDGFDPADLAALQTEDGKLDAYALGRLAIDFSDGVAVTMPDADPRLIEYARSKGKPVLEYPGGVGEDAADKSYIDKYHEFYLSL